MYILVNAITVSRIVLALSIFVIEKPSWILGITFWGALSDFLDGYLARSYNITTKFGAQLDQIADKIFQFCLFGWLLNLGHIHPIFMLLFFGREVAILILRHFNLSVSRSNFLGKLKTATAYAFIILIILELNFSLLSQHIFLEIIWYGEISLLLMTYYSLIQSLKQKEQFKE